MYIDPKEEGASLRTFTRKITGIGYMLQDSSDFLWVGTETGLFRVNVKKKAFSMLPGTGTYHIKSLLSTQEGELWITTDKNGLFILKDSKLIRLPLDKNKILHDVHCLVIDQNDFLWAPTNNGLFRIYRKDILDFTRHGDSTRVYYHHTKSATASASTNSMDIVSPVRCACATATYLCLRSTDWSFSNPNQYQWMYRTLKSSSTELKPTR